MTSTALKVAGLIEGGRNYTQDGKKTYLPRANLRWSIKFLHGGTVISPFLRARALYLQNRCNFCMRGEISRTEFRKFQRDGFLRFTRNEKSPRRSFSSFFMLETFAKRRKEPYVRILRARAYLHIHIARLAQARFQVNKRRDEKSRKVKNTFKKIPRSLIDMLYNSSPIFDAQRCVRSKM